MALPLPQLDATFQPAGGGRGGHRLYLHHRPDERERPARGCIVYVHPFAEEMNKSRRMAALQSRALASAGWAVLQVDLLGCGDSSGEFGDATWDDWVEDVVDAAGWLRARHVGAPPLWLWGLRAGALVACAAAARTGAASNLLLWQPALHGKTVLQQFLRLKAAGDLLDGGGKGVVDGLRRRLAAGESVEVAGYTVHPALAAGLDAAHLAPPAAAPAGAARTEWFDVQRDTAAQAAPSPAAAFAAQAWRSAGSVLRTHRVAGPAFWQTTEIEDAPDLLAATVAALAGGAVTTEVLRQRGQQELTRA